MALIPFQKGLAANAEAYENELKPYEQQALAGYGMAIKVVYDNGETIYTRSYAFCHGQNGD
ncbi:MAG: hypothetical protein ACUVQ2_00175 [Dissulfurimicrobium sp.]|uniref:hypothetical protein n=1 Tax=Dissulfurimicrobium sp. TaxID=2022436 RepID=UPI00404A56C7